MEYNISHKREKYSNPFPYKSVHKVVMGIYYRHEVHDAAKHLLDLVHIHRPLESY